MSENQYIQARQPDVLEVIANLSNNEVFTPPRVVNDVLDLLPKHVWKDKTLRWLDPGAKTGVFPREITKRLMFGLAESIPDEQERLRHILTEMVFAFAITDMTAMMTRRSLYCSKDASSALSAVQLPTPDGNVWHERIKHSFDKKGRCAECGGTKAQLEQPGRDNYAYGFIHKEGHQQITKETNMKFDVIVGNPPYQMGSGGDGTNATAIYDIFVEEAIKLNPMYVSMIIPSRWMAGGMGLDGFRSKMLSSRKLSHLVDYSQMRDLFPGVDFEGGICYFLWDRAHESTCATTYVQGKETIGPIDRDLAAHDVLVRDHRALEILTKVIKKSGESVVDIVSGVSPFGIPTNFKGYRKGEKKVGDIKLFLTESGKRTERWVSPEVSHKNQELMKGWKVLIPEAYGERGATPARVLGPTLLAGPRTICSHTYLAIGPVSTKHDAESLDSYLQTRFVRFLVSLRKISQHTNRSVFSWVPQQEWNRTWTDAELYKKYGITKEEQKYIESMVKEMPA